jgi:hypothetical protein
MNSTALAAGIRSVTQVADYFDELKGKVRQLAARQSAQQRGYFTPDEENDVRAMLVSYWKARNALYDQIMSYHRNQELAEHERPAAFLTAYAAVLVLVDAARFLRETVHDRPLVRDKLNEPSPEFGIDADFYERIQKSLMSSRNAWHLYHAIEYFRENESALRQRAAGTDLTGVMEVVDRLRHRLDLSVTQFARVKLRMRVARLWQMLTGSLLGRAMYGLQKWGGLLVADKYVRLGHHPALPAGIAGELADRLRPGDVIIVRKEYALTNYFLPGYWPHAALYLGTPATLAALEHDVAAEHQPRWRALLEQVADGSHHVLESMKDGVHLRALASPFASDSVVILRPRLAPQHVASALGRCLIHTGKPYDFDFDFRRSDRLVCTEVVYRALEGVGDVRLPLTTRAGRPTLSGSDLIHQAIAGTSFDPIAVYAPLLRPGIALDSAARDVLQAGEGEASSEA